MGDMQTDRLAELIYQKHRILQQLHELTKRQAEHVEQNEITRLLSLLAVKQGILNQLQQVETLLDPFRDDDPDQREWRSPEFRQETRLVSQACRELLRTIMKCEQDCETKLGSQRDDTAHRLQGVHSASQARAAYLDSGTTRRNQLDLSSET